MSSSVHIDNENKGTLIVDKGPTQGLDDTTIKTEGGYSINFSRSQKKKKNVQVSIINESTVFYLLIPQKYTFQGKKF